MEGGRSSKRERWYDLCRFNNATGVLTVVEQMDLGQQRYGLSLFANSQLLTRTRVGCLQLPRSLSVRSDRYRGRASRV